MAFIKTFKGHMKDINLESLVMGRYNIEEKIFFDLFNIILLISFITYGFVQGWANVSIWSFYSIMLLANSISYLIMRTDIKMELIEGDDFIEYFQLKREYILEGEEGFREMGTILGVLSSILWPLRTVLYFVLYILIAKESFEDINASKF